MTDAVNMAIEAYWAGDDSVLPRDVKVDLIGFIPDLVGNFHRSACWVRWVRPDGDHARYRSCDLSDLSISAEDLAALEQAGEPVAWMYDYRLRFRGDESDWKAGCVSTTKPTNIRPHEPDYRNIEPLYKGEAPLPTLQRLGQEFDAGEVREQIARIISLAKGQPGKGQTSVGAWWWDARHDRALPEHFEGECRDEDRKHADEMMPLLRSVFVGDALAAIEDVGEPVTRPIWNKACVGREGYCSSDLQDAALAAIGVGLKRGFNDGWLAAHKRLNFGYRAEDIQSDWDAYALAHSPQSRVAAEPVGLREALEAIDQEAPANEPIDAPTVGFPPSRDPEEYDGNDIVEEAFREGVSRGLWEAAKIAREALATPSQPDPQSREPSLTVADAWQDLVDKSDRTSPEEYPDMALITRDELADYMSAAAPSKDVQS